MKRLNKTSASRYFKLGKIIRVSDLRTSEDMFFKKQEDDATLNKCLKGWNVKPSAFYLVG